MNDTSNAAKACETGGYPFVVRFLTKFGHHSAGYACDMLVKLDEAFCQTKKKNPDRVLMLQKGFGLNLCRLIMNLCKDEEKALEFKSQMGMLDVCKVLAVILNKFEGIETDAFTITSTIQALAFDHGENRKRFIEAGCSETLLNTSDLDGVANA